MEVTVTQAEPAQAARTGKRPSKKAPVRSAGKAVAAKHAAKRGPSLPKGTSDPAKGTPDPVKARSYMFSPGAFSVLPAATGELTDLELRRIAEVCSALWTQAAATEQTSVRVPTTLRDAVRELQELGWAPSFSEVLVAGARNVVEELAHRAGLEAHYAEHPELRPSVTSVAIALAKMDASQLADHPELIEQAESELVATGRKPTPDEVLIYADALLLHGAIR